MNFHLHLLVDAYVDNPPQSEDVANDWLNRLVIALGMEKLGGPWSTYCDDPCNRGLTGQVWLTTSHSSFHFWDNADKPFVHFDVYSCRDYDVETVLELLKEFNPTSGHYTLINRSDIDKGPQISTGQI